MARFYNYKDEVTRDMFSGEARMNISTLSKTQMENFNKWLDSFSEVDFSDVEDMVQYNFGEVLKIVGDDEKEEFEASIDIIEKEPDETKINIPIIYPSDSDYEKATDEEYFLSDWEW